MCDKLHYDNLEDRVNGIDQRLTRVETSMTTGFSQVNNGIQNLAQQFGERMNILDRKIIEEKAKWGETLRRIVVWAAKVLLTGASVAMGVTAWNNFARVNF